jgi:hypothetical protein
MAVMRAEVARPYWDGAGLAKLLAALFIGPAAWGLNLQINYSLVKWACASGRSLVLPLCSLAALMLVAAGFFLSWRALVRLNEEADVRGDRVIDRSYFLAVAGLWLNALFALLVLTSGSLHFVVNPCE